MPDTHPRGQDGCQQQARHPWRCRVLRRSEASVAQAANVDRGGYAVINADGMWGAEEVSDQEATTRWERIARRVAQASSREDTGPASPLRLEITEALLIAQDL